MKRLFILLLAYISLCFPCEARPDWNSFVVNFGKNDFGTASATWRISLQEEFSVQSDCKSD